VLINGTVAKTFEGSKQDYPKPVEPPEMITASATQARSLAADDSRRKGSASFSGPLPKAAAPAAMVDVHVGGDDRYWHFCILPANPYMSAFGGFAETSNIAPEGRV